MRGRILVLGALLVASVSCEEADDEANGAPRKWEYSTIAGSPGPVAIKAHLDSAGAQGWELVAVTSGGAPPFQDVFYMKRPILAASAR